MNFIIWGVSRWGASGASSWARGADAVALGQGVLVALGCNDSGYTTAEGKVGVADDYAAIGAAPGTCHHCHTGRCPVGITTQIPEFERRLDPEIGARRLKNYFDVLTMELTALARACGKSNVHHLEPEDLVALTIEAAAMARVPLAGTNWIPGQSER